ncbi:MAG TPA: GNAT family N-acetyltransferase [Candidatus Cloacimonadota bacterium]|nr:GNAT family N-acetyltransferase [Candidatus Cloacimonadota bacterium]HPT72359.1 GNAT family N-acetyltransferase [Candidatus Cloacimonadota bacterium]
MSILDHYWAYELGDEIFSDQTTNREIKFYAAKHRLEKNPFRASFPFLIKETESKILISVPYKKDVDLIVNIVTQTDLTTDIFATMIQTELFPLSSTIEVNRYLDIGVNNSSAEQEYNRLSGMQIDQLKSVCSLDESTLYELNENGKLFALFDGMEPLSYGTVTRSSGNWIEISIATVKEHRHKGYATTLARRMMNHFRSQQKHVIYVCETGNMPSNRIAEDLELHFLGSELLGYLKDNHE